MSDDAWMDWAELEIESLKRGLEQAERERDDANEACREKRAIIERMLESDKKAVALMRQIRWDMGDVDGLPQDEYKCLLRRIDAYLAGQPAPAPVVDDAMVGLALAGYVGGLCNYHGSDDTERIKAGIRSALVAALEGKP